VGYAQDGQAGAFVRTDDDLLVLALLRRHGSSSFPARFPGWPTLPTAKHDAT
jgi:hypothetical protein